MCSAPKQTWQQQKKNTGNTNIFNPIHNQEELPTKKLEKKSFDYF